MIEISIGGWDYGEDTLNCPKCDCEYMHHERTEIYNRVEDCENVGFIEVVGHDRTHIDIENRKFTKGKGNPSSRRQAICLIFSCEGCRRYYKLNIGQHKGVTFVYWADDKGFSGDDEEEVCDYEVTEDDSPDEDSYFNYLKKQIVSGIDQEEIECNIEKTINKVSRYGLVNPKISKITIELTFDDIRNEINTLQE